MVEEMCFQPSDRLHDDGVDVAQPSKKMLFIKNAHLELILGQIGDFSPVKSRNAIIKGSTSSPDIWQNIRQHYSFHSSGKHFLNFVKITLKPAEDLRQRLTSFVA